MFPLNTKDGMGCAVYALVIVLGVLIFFLFKVILLEQA
jgi:hypothetical protein